MTDEPEAQNESADDIQSQSMKVEVIEWLFRRHWPAGSARPRGRMLVTRHEVVEGIQARNNNHAGARKLSVGNPANFLKDFIRKRTCNANWPQALKSLRITARQVYGGENVLEFVDYLPDDLEPFPDRFDPTPDMEVIPFEALSIPVEARELGRPDEAWLIQVIVSQRILYTHFAIVARDKDPRVQTLAHLQTSVKTQPEIDATFVANVVVGSATAAESRLRAYVTCEAKQHNERILEHQIKEQVGKAFELTALLEGENAIGAVIPTVFQVIDHVVTRSDGSASKVRGIYLAQFTMIRRSDFEARYKSSLHEMPLAIQSRAFYEPFPMIKGISKFTLPRPGPKATKRRRRIT